MPKNTSKCRGAAFEVSASDPLAVIMTGRGYCKAGYRGRITAGCERTVFLGPDSDLKEFRLPEFTIELEKGGKFESCQYSRDFVFLSSPEGQEINAKGPLTAIAAPRCR